MLTSVKLVASVVCLLAVSACLPSDETAALTTEADAGSESTPAVVTEAPPGPVAAAPASPAPAPAPEVARRSGAASAPTAAAAAVLLRAASGGDGDSWRDTAGNEYRLGLVNAPETNECFGTEATAKRQALTAKGFTAQVYSRDTYGRDVSVVTTADGVNLNVYLARTGLVDDRYLEKFRAENPALGKALDQAFASAKAERAGLWGVCASPRRESPAAAAPRTSGTTPPLPAASSAGCHPDYATCIPVKGNGSGRGEANDLDCGSIGKAVTVRVIGVDPYRLDANSDGAGCE